LDNGSQPPPAEMKKIPATLALFFFCTLLQGQPEKVKGKVSSIDTADLSILNIYPATFPDVSVVFRAETRKGEPVWNLTKEKMRVTENGRSCDVISLEQLSANKSISIGIVFDHSGSMEIGNTSTIIVNSVSTTQYTSPIDSAKKAVKNFIKSFNVKKDAIGVIGFSDSVDVRLPATQDIKKLNSTIDSMRPTSSTALYDAMITGIEEIKKTEGIKVLVALTDGQDNLSKSTWQEVAKKAIQENIPVYIVGLGDVNKKTLQSIAKEAKGRCYFTESSSSLDMIYAEISKHIQAFYDLSYRSENFSSADSARSIDLSFDVDSIYLVTAPSSVILPTEVVETLAKKENRREYLLYGGIGIVALVVTGLLTYRFTRNRKDQKKDTAPVIKGVFPNPSSGPVTIQIEGKATQVQFLNIKGQVVGTYSVTGGQVQFDFSSSPRGNYIVVAFYGASRSQAVQFILE
jgi:Ca-activated chloride channel family protein